MENASLLQKLGVFDHLILVQYFRKRQQPTHSGGGVNLKKDFYSIFKQNYNKYLPVVQV
jgi:hypothetical protein